MPPNRSRHRSGGALFLGSPPRLVCGVNSHSTIPRPASARRGCGNAANVKDKGTSAAFLLSLRSCFRSVALLPLCGFAGVRVFRWFRAMAGLVGGVPSVLHG